jgi:hypothetical protein
LDPAAPNTKRGAHAARLGKITTIATHTEADMKLVYDGNEGWVSNYRAPESETEVRICADYPDRLAWRYILAKEELAAAEREMNEWFYSVGHKQVPDVT